MTFRSIAVALVLVLPLGIGIAYAVKAKGAPPGEDPAKRIFELRTYYVNEGKMPDLHKRFRDHTARLFQKHGMTLIGFWEPREAKDGRGEKMVYLLAFPNKEAAQKSWKAFQDDSEWQKVYKESHKDGALVKKVESTYLDPMDYSPIK